MSWRDRLLPASLGGVEFYVQSSTTTGGRRTDVQPYPLKDGASIRDLGQEQEEFSLRAFLVGDDYDLELRELEAVLRSPGPYSLVHPYSRGAVDVSQTSKYQVTESADEQGGFASITISLIMDEGERHPTLGDPTSDLEAASSALGFAAEAAFEDGFNLAKAVGGVVGKVHKALADLSSAILAAKGKITSIANVPLTTIQLLDSIAEQMVDLIEAPGLLARAIFENLVDLFRALPTADDDSDDDDRRLSVAIDLCIELLGDAVAFRTDPAVGTGVQAGIETEAKAQIEQLFKVVIIAAITGSISNMQLDSGAQAVLFNSEFMKKVGEIQEDILDVSDDVFLATELSKAAVHRFTLISAQDLPRVVSVFVPVDTPAIVLAYELLGDANLAGDIVRRNRIRNPNAVPGGTTIEVIVDA